LDADRQIDDDRLHRFLVRFFKRPHAPAAVADEIGAGIVVIGNDVDCLLLALLCQIDGKVGNRRLQIEMARIERARLDRFEREFDDLARTIGVFNPPRTVVRRLIGDLGASASEMSCDMTDWIARLGTSPVLAPFLTKPSMHSGGRGGSLFAAGVSGRA
jgi:hypothetical protein